MAQTVTITAQQTPLKTILNMTEEQTGYFVFYSNKDLRKKASEIRVTFSVKKMPLINFLDMIFKDHPIVYRIEDKNIALLPKDTDNRDTTARNEHPAKVMIQGQVTDKDGNPVRQVTVFVKGTSIIGIGDERGNYKVSVPSGKDGMLAFSSIGYEPKEVIVGTQNVINVVMDHSNAKLGEVVVVGYGTATKGTMTGSVSTVKGKKLNENHANTAVSNMLSGRLAGLFVTQQDGIVGGGANVQVRGFSTFNEADPLIVIDGIPGRSLDDLNPVDIESVSVLKDASAIAVYGARGANGVILVTTRKGSIGKPEITFSATLVNQSPTAIYKSGSSYQYATLQNEAYTNEGTFNPVLGRGFTQQQLELFQNGKDPDRYPNTNWIKEVTRANILQSRYDLAASGGGDAIRYFISAGYVQNGGFFPVDKYKRFNLRSNLEAKVSRNLKLNLNLNGIFEMEESEASNGHFTLAAVFSTPPTRVNRFRNGYYAMVPEQLGNAAQMAAGEGGFNKNYSNELNSTMSMEWNLPWIKGLSILGTAAYDKDYSFQKNFLKQYNIYQIDHSGEFVKVPPSVNPGLREEFNQSASLTLEGSLNYSTTFADVNHLGAMLLYTQTKRTSDMLSAGRQGFVSWTLPALNLGNPSQMSNGGYGSLSTRQGLVGRLTYDYDTKYLFEYSFRYDGSDLFPPGHRFGFFPAFSAGWVLSNERFFKVKDLDYLKIRASWGQMGNDGAAPYQFLTTYELNDSYAFGGPKPVSYQGLFPQVLPNPSFTWEKTVSTNIGLEAHYKEDFLTLEADYFRKRTKDILTSPNLKVPSVIGVRLPPFNNAVVDNNGFEISLGHHYNIGQVSYFIEANVSYSQNRIVYYPESPGILPWQKIVGTSVTGFDRLTNRPYLGYKAEGLYQSEEEIAAGPRPLFANVRPGDIKYADIDKDGKITPNDMIALGDKYFPRFQYGIQLGASYEGFECAVLLQGTAQSEGINSPAQLNAIPAADWMQDHWTPQHPNATFPRLWINNQNNQQPSTYWTVNNAYLRIKNIELAYTLPSQWINNAFKSVRIVLSANNLVTFSKFKSYDPEVVTSLFPTTTSNHDKASFLFNPILKSFTAGLTVQF